MTNLRMNILVAEWMPAAGLELLTPQPGWHVIISNPEEFRQHLPHADALIVRNAIQVDKELIGAAPHLKVIGKAGTGAENIDVEAATAAGVLVMNTPGGNAVSVAEHTLGLMLAMARSIPQAAVSTKSGDWGRVKYVGTELRGKTLGVVGLGSIGQEVVRRARAFEMKIIANDPYVNSQSAADLGATLRPLSELFAQSDYITLHVALTLETYALLNAAAFAKMKKGVRIVNCARGELIDGEALRKAIESGKVAGAALDVFQTEPPDSSEPLLKLDNVIATPHIGGATEEAQETVGVRIAEQIVQYLRQGVALNSVNVPAMTTEQYRTVGPYAALAERLGTFAAYVATGNPRMMRLVYHGNIVNDIADQNTHLVRNAGLAGVLSRSLHRKANVVNALQIATERGLGYAERHEKRVGHADSLKLELETDEGVTQVEGALVLDRPRLLSVGGIRCEAPLTGHLMYLRNADVPGVIGYVGSVTGRNKINIANFSLGRQHAPSEPGGVLEAIAVVKTDEPVSESVLQQLLENKSITVARAVEFRD
jgi:D-3-phosphoglycerate dehydrogenase